VTTELDLGRTPRGARLREDDTRELDRLVDRLTALGGDDHTVNRTAADWVLGDGTPKIDRCADVERLIPGYRSPPLNERQRMAVEHALTSDVTFIWGPPGTGKTEVVSRIVEGNLRQGSRVLFLAPSNIAVDQALERICALVQGEPGFDSGLVQRAGDTASASLREKFGANVSPELLVSRLTATLLERAACLEEQLARIRVDIELHERARLADEELATARARHRELQDEVARLAKAGKEATNAARSVATALARIGTPSGLFATYQRNKVDALRREQQERSGEALLAALALVGLTAARTRRGVSPGGVFDVNDPDVLIDWMSTAALEVAGASELSLDDLLIDRSVVPPAAEFLRVVGRLAVRHGWGESRKDLWMRSRESGSGPWASTGRRRRW
jgi:hypothetical protein